jgi:hypothetical protein
MAFVRLNISMPETALRAQIALACYFAYRSSLAYRNGLFCYLTRYRYSRRWLTENYDIDTPVV